MEEKKVAGTNERESFPPLVMGNLIWPLDKSKIFFFKKRIIYYYESAQAFAEGVHDVEFDVGKSSHGGQGEVLKFVVAANVLAHRADAFPVVYHVLV